MKIGNVVFSFSAVFILSLILAFACLITYLANTVDIESVRDTKNTFIEVEKNSIGCIKYRYNNDYVWKCPKDLNINQIDSRVCNRSGNVLNCKTISEPVL